MCFFNVRLNSKGTYWEVIHTADTISDASDHWKRRKKPQEEDLRMLQFILNSLAHIVWRIHRVPTDVSNQTFTFIIEMST